MIGKQIYWHLVEHVATILVTKLILNIFRILKLGSRKLKRGSGSLNRADVGAANLSQTKAKTKVEKKSKESRPKTSRRQKRKRRLKQRQRQPRRKNWMR